jgi:multiple sugar transport system substrate-binding protein
MVEQFAREFEEQNPGAAISIESIPFDQYFDKLITGLSTGTGPDVFQVPMTMSEQLIASDALAPVPDSVTSSEEIEASFLPWTIQRFQSEGQYFGLPTDTQTLITFINVDLLAECGGDPEDPPATWEDFAAQARQCTVRDAAGTMTQAGLDTRYRQGVYWQLLYSMIDGPVVDVEQQQVTYDSEQGIAAWQFFADLLSGPEAVDSAEFLTGQQKFEQGKAVFYINHPVTRGRLALEAPDINWTVAPPPVPAGSEPVTAGHSWFYVVNAQAGDQEAAWRWIQHLTSEEAQIQWTLEAGDLPSRIALVGDPRLTTDEEYQIAMDSLDYARPVEQIGHAEAQRVYATIWDRVVLEGVPVEQAVEEGATEENQLIQRLLGGG